jgi:acyl-CoA thioester hydrolase
MKKAVEIQVRFSDLDVMGHVNNAVYLSYFEMARIAYFTPVMGVEWDWQKFGVLLKYNTIEYHRPVLLHDTPKIFIFIETIGTKSFTLGYQLKVKDLVCTTGSSVMVCYDSEVKKTIVIPEKMKDALIALQ